MVLHLWIYKNDKVSIIKNMTKFKMNEKIGKTKCQVTKGDLLFIDVVFNISASKKRIKKNSRN